MRGTKRGGLVWAKSFSAASMRVLLQSAVCPRCMRLSMNSIAGGLCAAFRMRSSRSIQQAR